MKAPGTDSTFRFLIDRSIDQSIDLSIYRSIDLSIYQSIDLSIYLSIDRSIASLRVVLAVCGTRWQQPRGLAAATVAATAIAIAITVGGMKEEGGM